MSGAPAHEVPLVDADRAREEGDAPIVIIIIIILIIIITIIISSSSSSIELLQ